MNEIEQLLKSGADVNTKDKNNYTLLMNFVEKDDEETVKVLLQYGVNSNLKNLFNLTALDYAIKNNSVNMVKLLVENGAVVTNDNYMLAVQTNSKEIVSYLDSLDPNKKIFLKKK